VQPLRALEPEQTWLEQPPEPAPETFADRELGVLADQGNFERARTLLARRAVERPNDARLLLDAMRLERCAAPSGEAWQAWLARGLSAGAAIAAGLPGLLPPRALGAYLARAGVGWEVLRRQPHARSARDLLRLRLDGELLQGEGAELAALEQPALQEAARADVELERIALAVLASALLRDPPRALDAARGYGIDLVAGADARADSTRLPELVARLKSAYALRAAWQQANARSACPALLERLMRCGAFVSARSQHRMLAELHGDLRGRSREYLAFADAMAFASPALEALLREALAVEGAPADAGPTTDALAVERVIHLAVAAQRRDARWRAFLRPFERRVYHQSLRSPLLRGVCEEGLALGPLCERLRDSRLPRAARMAALASADPGLRVLDALREAGSTSGQ